jgi:hypothetical protein
MASVWFGEELFIWEGGGGVGSIGAAPCGLMDLISSIDKVSRS